MNSNGKRNRKRSGLNRYGLKKNSRAKRVGKKYNDFVMTNKVKYATDKQAA